MNGPIHTTKAAWHRSSQNVARVHPRRLTTDGDVLSPFHHRRRHPAQREPILITISAKPDGICLGGAPQCAVASPERRRHELRARWSVAMVLGRPPALHWLAWRQPATRRGQRRAKPGRRRFGKGGDTHGRQGCWILRPDGRRETSVRIQVKAAFHLKAHACADTRPATKPERTKGLQLQLQLRPHTYLVAGSIDVAGFQAA